MKAIGAALLICFLSTDVALATSGCTGSETEIGSQTAQIQADILKSGYKAMTEFKSAPNRNQVGIAKNGVRHVYTYVVTNEYDSTYRMVGTTLFGGDQCTVLETFRSGVQ
jgi:hypothetical protein